MTRLFSILLILSSVGLFYPLHGQGDFSGQDFSNSNLASQNFTNSNFSGAILKCTNLTGTIFSGANLTNADLRGSLLNGTTFTDATLSGAIFTSAAFFRSTLWPTGFNPAGKGMFGPFQDYSGRIFTLADFSLLGRLDLDFHGSNFTKASLRKLNLTRTDFSSANLSGADLSGTFLNFTDFSNSILTETTFTGAAFFRTTIWPEGFNPSGKDMFGPFQDYSGRVFSLDDFKLVERLDLDFHGSKFINASLDSLNWTLADFSSANLSGANLSGTFLNITNFTDAKLDSADFSGAAFFRSTIWPIGFNPACRGMLGPYQDYRGKSFSSEDFAGIKRVDVDFYGSDFTGAVFNSLNLTGASFSSAILNNVDFKQSFFNITDFSNAALFGADFSTSNIFDANFQGAKFDSSTKWPQGFNPVNAGAILIDSPNAAPTSISLSQKTVTVGLPSKSIVGELSAYDENGGELTFSLSGCYADNSLFIIEGNLLKTRKIFSALEKNNFFINVKVTDPGGLSFETLFEIYVLPTDLPANGLIGWWPFNGNANDESGNENHGVVTEAVPAADRKDLPQRAYSFSSTTNSVIVPIKKVTSVKNNFSYSVWIKPTEALDLPQQKLDNQTAIPEISVNNGVIHPMHGGNFGPSQANAGSGLFAGTNGLFVVEHSDFYLATTLVFRANLCGWHHVTIVYENKVPRLYLDGLLVHTGISGTRDVYPSIGPDSIYPNSGFGAAYRPNPGRPFNGSIDDVAFWNRPLSDNEILGLYPSGTPGKFITFSELSSATYGDAPLTLNASSTSCAPIQYTSSNSGVAQINGNILTITGAGTAVITATQPGDSTTLAATPISKTLTVAKATLTASASDASKVYGDGNPTFVINYSGFKNNETAGVLDTAPTATSTATPTSETGTYPITVSGGTDNNYTFNYTNATLTVGKATLTVKADDLSRPYNTTNPTLTLSYSGFKNGDAASVIDTAPTASTTAVITSLPGTYPITVSGGTDNNYSFSYSPGTLTVTKLSQTITFTLPALIYQDQSPYTLVATSNTTGPIVFSVVEGNATISGNILTLTGSGALKVKAAQAGTDIYAAAETIAASTVANSYIVSGLITKPVGIPLVSGLAKLFYEDGGLAKNGEVVNGAYSISLVRPGRYILQVVPTGSEDSKVFPAYYNAAVLNKDATVIVVDGNITINMEMPAKPSSEPKGQGEIKGKVTGGNGGGRFIVGRIADGVGLPNVPVYLLDTSDKVLKTVLTDKDGLFSFTELITGTYKLALDIVGASLGSSSTTVNVDPAVGVLEVSAAVSTVNGQPVISLSVEVITGLSYGEVTLRAYPNPADDEVRLVWRSDSDAPVELQLVTSSGQVVQRQSHSVAANSENELTVSLRNLPQGMYLLSAEQGVVRRVLKVVRR